MKYDTNFGKKHILCHSNTYIQIVKVCLFFSYFFLIKMSSENTNFSSDDGFNDAPVYEEACKSGENLNVSVCLNVIFFTLRKTSVLTKLTFLGFS